MSSTSSCLYLPSPGFTGVCHHGFVDFVFFHSFHIFHLPKFLVGILVLFSVLTVTLIHLLIPGPVQILNSIAEKVQRDSSDPVTAVSSASPSGAYHCSRLMWVGPSDHRLPSRESGLLYWPCQMPLSCCILSLGTLTQLSTDRVHHL